MTSRRWQRCRCLQAKCSQRRSWAWTHCAAAVPCALPSSSPGQIALLLGAHCIPDLLPAACITPSRSPARQLAPGQTLDLETAHPGPQEAPGVLGGHRVRRIAAWQRQMGRACWESRAQLSHSLLPPSPPLTAQARTRRPHRSAGASSQTGARTSRPDTEQQHCRVASRRRRRRRAAAKPTYRRPTAVRVALAAMSTAASGAGSKLRMLWNHPAGPKVRRCGADSGEGWRRSVGRPCMAPPPLGLARALPARPQPPSVPSPSSPLLPNMRTIHFWAPAFKWGISFANIAGAGAARVAADRAAALLACSGHLRLRGPWRARPQPPPLSAPTF